jgi:GTP-binding protein
VDLPGYGFAQCSKTERDAWAALIRDYMAGNDRLAAVCVLLDCRLTPQRLDLDLVSFVRASAIPLVPVLTKADKCKLGERAARQREWSGLLEGYEPVLFSSRTGLGRDKLWERLRLAAGSGEDGREEA